VCRPASVPSSEIPLSCANVPVSRMLCKPRVCSRPDQALGRPAVPPSFSVLLRQRALHPQRCSLSGPSFPYHFHVPFFTFRYPHLLIPHERPCPARLLRVETVTAARKRRSAASPCHECAWQRVGFWSPTSTQIF
jgi:hypothetical protein